MIIVRKKMLPFIDRQVIWYDSKPSVFNCLSTLYKQTKYSKNVFGFERKDFYTKLIDLSKSEEEIMSGFDKDTLYEIRRATKDGVTTGIETSLDKFIAFYNEFAGTKKLPPVNNINSYGNSLLITKAISDDESVVMHSYIIDEGSNRVRLLHSASLYRNVQDNPAKRTLIGRANRLLHFADMQYFKKKGFLYYDMGGYAFETSDTDLQKINRFKDSFGGELIKENDYWPKTMLLIMKLFTSTGVA